MSDTYRVVVEFTRSRTLDQEYIEKREGESWHEKAAQQFATELQEAYETPDCALDGNFLVLTVEDTEGNIREINQPTKMQSLREKESRIYV